MCKVTRNRIPRNKIALLRASKFNEVVAVDLKENKKFKNAHPYILYLVCTFRRFKVGVFLPDKKAITVAEAILSRELL